MSNRRGSIQLRAGVPASSAPRRGRDWVRGVPAVGNLSALRTQDSGLLWLGSDGSPDYDYSAYGLSPNDPFNTTAVGGYREWGGGLTAPIRRADILPAVTRITQLLVGPVVRSLWRFYRDAGANLDPSDVRQGREEFVRPLWIVDPQLYSRTFPGGTDGRPVLPRGKRLPTHDFWRTLLTHTVWFGAGAILYAKDRAGAPLAGTLRILHPDRWGVTEDGRYVLAAGTDEELVSDDDGCFVVGGTVWCIQVMHGFAPNDGSVPEGALTRSGLLLATAERTNSYLSSIFNSGVPSGILKVNTPANSVKQEQINNLKAMWKDAHGGPNREIAVLSSTVEYQPLQMSVVDADAARINNVNLINLAHAFGVSAVMVDAAISGSSITYQRLADVRQEHLTYALADWGRTVEDFVSAMLPWGSAMKIDWTSFLMVDKVGSVPLVDSGLANGYLTIDEVRDMFGFTPTDVHQVPGYHAGGAV